jgi:lipoate-protein ligase A
VSLWRLIDSGSSPAWRNMALDEALALEAERPVLRFYGWSAPSVSIGCFQSAEEVDLGAVADEGMHLVRRITGGRGILHARELTYSFSAPNAGVFSGGLRQSYMALGEAFARAFEALGLEPETSGPERTSSRDRSPLCFESASLGEIKLGGRKIVGSAQKRWPERFMQQGSVPFAIDFSALARVFKAAGRDAERTMAGLLDVEPSLSPDALKAALAEAFEEVFGIGFEESGPTAREEMLAADLEAKYRSAQWNLSRQRRVPAVPGSYPGAKGR